MGDNELIARILEEMGDTGEKGDPGEKGEQGEAGVIDYTGLATTTYVDTGLELKADKTYVDSKGANRCACERLFTDT